MARTAIVHGLLNCDECEVDLSAARTILPSPSYHYDKGDSIQRAGSLDVDFKYGDCQLRLICKFLFYGYDIRESRQEFAHPMPCFSRIFLFHRAGGEFYAGDRRHELIPGVIYLLPPGQPFEVAYHAGSELLFCHVSVCDHTMTSIFPETMGPPSIEDSALAERMTESWRSGDCLRLQLAFAESIARFAEPLKDAMRSRSLLAKKFERIFEIMHTTPPGRLRVDELAEVMGMTRAALSKSFARAMGIPLKSYMTELHLKKACELLLFSDMSVAELSGKLGHADPHYFHRAFKRSMGCTPNIYRKRHGELRQTG